jgi:protein-disulfide isomerase/uncharacterized membrane protein YphA (DoxX/SURF4 family)
MPSAVLSRRPAPVQAPRSPDLLDRAAVVARLVLAAVLAYAALTKIGDPAATVRAVRAYQLLPEAVVVPFGHALPWVELALAVLLLLGVAIRLTAALTAAVMALFVVGIATAWARGLKIDCGCFGGGGVTADPSYAGELARDGLLLGLAIGLAVLGRSAWALQRPAPALPVEPDGASRNEQRQHRTALGHALEQQRLSRLRHQWSRVGAVALVLVAALIGIASAPTPSVAAAVPTGVTARGGVLVGAASAPKHLVVFEDPQCPVCEQFERISGPTLQQAVAARAVQVEYRMRSFLGPESVRAVAALGAAAQLGRFEPLREQLFAHQPPERTGGYTVRDLLALGAAAGLTEPAYTRAVTQQTFAGWARSIDEQASKDGNVGTPELRLDGTALDPQTVFNPAGLARALGLT